MLFEIGDKIIRMQVRGLRHFFNLQARTEMVLDILLDEADPLHILGTVLQNLNRHLLQVKRDDF